MLSQKFQQSMLEINGKERIGVECQNCGNRTYGK